MNKQYHLSEYVKRLDRDDDSALFNGLNLKKAYGRRDVIDFALKTAGVPYFFGRDKNVDSLIENNFLTEPGQDENTFRSLRDRVGRISISNIVMLVDNGCNYACRYCQIEENMEIKQQRFRMPLEVASKALDLYEKNSKDASKRTVTITGGEPLMNIPTVKYIIERTQDIPNTRRIVFTNGSLVTKELADYFSRSDTLMLVSLDGTPEIHDSVRIKRGGQGTFDVSLRGYNLLRDAGCKVGISSVTGTHNVDRMDEVSNFFSDLNPPSIGLNFGHHLLGKENPTMIPMEKFAKILTNFYSKMRDKRIFVENISRFITPFYLEQPRYNECQAQGRGFTVDSRGMVGVCKSLLVSDIIAKPLDEMPEDISTEPIFQEWANRSPFNLEECIKCDVIGICGGGCNYDAFAINNGDIRKRDPRQCDYTNAVLEFLIWDLFDDIKDKTSEWIYIPTIEEQEKKFLRYYNPKNELQRSVGHEKDR